MSEIVFEEPPQDGRNRSGRDHAGTAEALRARPGEWAKVFTCDGTNPAGTAAWQIRTGRLAPYRPSGAFEAMSRNGDVYARFVGGGDE